MSFKGLKRFTDIKTDGYSRISNHGVIANNRSAALISMDGTIDWACFPNFSSPPIFSSILDRDKGGYFSVMPSNTDDVYVSQYYKEFTNILVTEFVKGGKTILRITDFLPATDYTTISFPEIHRLVETQSEDVSVELKMKPLFNYGTEPYQVSKRKSGYVFKGPETSFGIVSDIPLDLVGNMVSTTILMPKRSSKWVITIFGIRHLNDVEDYKSYERLEETSEYWHNWSSKSVYKGVYDSEVMRSALTLKGLFYEPTGLMVAAPTASLPESIGGERNWDYRFTWVRDTAYVIDSLALLGYKREATKFLYDMMEIIEKDGRIKTIYTINNDLSLDEKILDMDGHMGSKPVRIGNMASSQLQIDQYGSIINAIYSLNKVGGIINSYLWNFVGETLDTLAEIWQKPDSSIWEFRTEPRHYVYSKLVAWAAFNRAIEMGKDLGFSGPYRKWQFFADKIKQDIIEKGFNKKINSFSQYYGSDETDSALLRMPLLDFLPPDDYRIKGTVEKIEKDLMTPDHLFRRYLEDDGLRGRDNAFLLLSFWYVEVLVTMNRVQEAKNIFDSLLEKGNHLALFAEEADLDTGELMGNFPQAITHLGVIRAAFKLNKVLRINSRSDGYGKRVEIVGKM